MVDTEQGKLLLQLARAAIERELGKDVPLPPRTEWLEQPGAAFVTLTTHGRLRGCIGSLDARRALYDDVRHNALAAAFSDPRFPPLGKEELTDVAIEVSLLSPPQRMVFSNEQDALQQLHPGRDGVILEYRSHRATYLPQVWEQLPEPADFIDHLKEKAGLPATFWSPEIRLSRYRVQKFSEGGAHHG